MHTTGLIKWLSISSAILFLSGCAQIEVKDTTIWSYVGENASRPGVVALGSHTIFDKQEEKTIDEWIDFLLAQSERPDPKNPDATLPPKGPAICISSDDYTIQKTVLDQACAAAHCTYEQKKILEKISNHIERVNAWEQLEKQTQSY